MKARWFVLGVILLGIALMWFLLGAAATRVLINAPSPLPSAGFAMGRRV